MVQSEPPNDHSRNVMERAIRTFKHYFVEGLASVYNDFTIYLWCWILKQAEITITLLRESRTNPGLLENAQIFGTFDFNAKPMAPPGTKIISH